MCPGGICRQSLLLGSNTTRPDPRAPHRVVLPLARGDVSDIRSGAMAVTCTPGSAHSEPQCGISDRVARSRMGAGDLVLSPTRGAIVSGAIRTRRVRVRGQGQGQGQGAGDPVLRRTIVSGTTRTRRV